MARPPMRFGLGNLKWEHILAGHLGCSASFSPSDLYTFATLLLRNWNVPLELRNNQQFANGRWCGTAIFWQAVFHMPRVGLIRHRPDSVNPRSEVCLCWISWLNIHDFPNYWLLLAWLGSLLFHVRNSHSIPSIHLQCFVHNQTHIDLLWYCLFLHILGIPLNDILYSFKHLQSI